MTSSNAQSGNVLFLILLAVALFAALSYAVTSSTRSGGGDASKEKIQLQANELMNFGSTVKVAVDRLRASGCSVNQISFDGPVTGKIRKAASDSSFAYVNGSAPGNGKCNVFDPRGAGVSFPNISPGVQVASKLVSTDHNKSNIYFFNGNNQVHDVGVTTNSELMMFAPFLTKNLCDFINQKNGISGSYVTSLDTNDNHPWQGTYNTWGFITGSFTGKFSGCIEKGSSTGDYYFYQVLIPQ